MTLCYCAQIGGLELNSSPRQVGIMLQDGNIIFLPAFAVLSGTKPA